MVTGRIQTYRSARGSCLVTQAETAVHEDDELVSPQQRREAGPEGRAIFVHLHPGERAPAREAKKPSLQAFHLVPHRDVPILVVRTATVRHVTRVRIQTSSLQGSAQRDVPPTLIQSCPTGHLVFPHWNCTDRRLEG
ncbi:hypothetical protein DPEC_G00170640, partial [Dallia pectoralis]